VNSFAKLKSTSIDTSKAALVKKVACLRRVGIPVYECCVIIDNDTENMCKAQMQKLHTMLVNL